MLVNTRLSQRMISLIYLYEKLVPFCRDRNASSLVLTSDLSTNSRRAQNVKKAVFCKQVHVVKETNYHNKVN